MKPRPLFELHVMGRKVRLGERTLIMGVLNVTPDSFSDGGLYLEPKIAVAHGIKLAQEGADWLDVGGESTRPGSLPISAEEEAGRVLPVIRELRRKLPHVPISVDTTKASVAEQAVQAGASILNDISGLRFDPMMAEVARQHRVPLILMHIRGRPENMQKRPFVRSIWRSIQDGLEASIERALVYGVRRSQLIIDPGLGFGKSRSQNFEIFKRLDRLQRFGLPVLVGTSRKSFIRAVAGKEPSAESLRRSQSVRSAHGQASSNLLRQVSASQLQLGDAAAVAASIINGAHIVRVHDVAHILPAVRVADAILNPKYY